MPKSTQTYWNPLLAENTSKWKPIAEMENYAEELTMSIDEESYDFIPFYRGPLFFSILLPILQTK